MNKVLAAIAFILIIIVAIIFPTSCVQESNYGYEGMAFRVTSISTPASLDTKTNDCTTDLILFQEDSMTLSVSESPLLFGIQTKGHIYSQNEGIGDESLGIVAVHHERTGAYVGNWKVYSPGFVRADAFSSGSSKAWLPSPSMSWPGSGYLRLFAYAPYSSAVTVSARDGAWPTLRYEVPENVEDQLDLLVCATSEFSGYPRGGDLSVPLSMKHALAGIRFRVGPGLTLKSVLVQGIRDAGLYNYSTSTWSNTSSSRTYELSDPIMREETVAGYNGYMITADDQTFLFIPQSFSGYSAATITAVVNDGEADRSIVARLGNTSWDAGRVYTYTITTRAKQYTLACTDQNGNAVTEITLESDKSLVDAVNSLYITSYQNYYSGVVAEPWKIEYSEDDGQSWTSEAPAWLSVADADGLYASGGAGGDFGELRKLHIDANPWKEPAIVFEAPQAGAAANMIATLRNRTPVGSKERPRDLSLYNIYGEPYGAQTSVPSITAAGRHSANCYVISGPGWYCFPLVFGNSLDATRGDEQGINKSAFSYRERYYGYLNPLNPETPHYRYYIETPTILPSDVRLSGYELIAFWQDVVSGFQFISDMDIVRADEIGQDYDCLYARFQIKQGDFNKITTERGTGYTPGGILPGNGIIAIRDIDSETAIWSWHIWVTDMPRAAGEDFSLVQLGDEKTLLNCDLGWAPPLSFRGRSTIERNAKIKISQIQGDANPHIISLKQAPVRESDYEGGIYSAVYFQWGRKNPFFSMQGIAYDAEKGYMGKCVSYDKNVLSPRNSLTEDERAYLSTTTYLSATTYNSVTWYRPPLSNSLYDIRAEGFYPFALKEAYLGFEYRNYEWNTNYINSEIATDSSDPMLTKPVIKSIFDPCPAGFCIMNGISSLDGVTIKPSGKIDSGDYDGYINNHGYFKYELDNISRWWTVVPAGFDDDMLIEAWAIEVSPGGQVQLTRTSVLDALCVRPMLESL